MKRLSSALPLVVAAIVAVSIAACSTTQSPGEQVDDASIHTSLKAKLTADRFSNIVNIDINVTNGVVTLAGEVPNAQVKAEAEAEARSVKGVVKVINNLQVKTPPTA
jgi:hyperosmotically inducible protein